MKILDADCEATDIQDIFIRAENSNKEQQVSLRILLNEYRGLFDGSLGDFNVPII